MEGGGVLTVESGLCSPAVALLLLGVTGKGGRETKGPSGLKTR